MHLNQNNKMSEKVENKIGQNFTIWGLTKFAFPAFLTNVVAQLFHSLDDGLFVSRYVGEKALAGLSLLNPMAGVQLGTHHLFALGSANISAKLMGEGKQKDAKQVFTRVVICGFIFAGLFALLTNVFSKPLLTFLGADEETIYFATYQIRIVYLIAPISMVDQIFSNYYSTAGKPKMGLICSIVNGVFNIGLDFLLIVQLKMGVVGACIATAAGDVAVFIIGLLFYSNKNNEIHFVAPEGNFINTSIESAKYALPQAINSASFGVTTLITNKVILDMIGNSGIAANAIISDIRKILTSGLVGFAACVGPIIAFNYGSRNIERLKKTFKDIAIIWIIGSILLTSIGLILREPLIRIFMSDESTQEFFDLTYLGLTIELFATFAVSGVITISRSFIALSKPKIAGFLSIMRNLVIKAIAFIVIPMVMGSVGIWISYPFAEIVSFLLGLYLVYINKDNLLYRPE